MTELTCLNAIGILIVLGIIAGLVYEFVTWEEPDDES